MRAQSSRDACKNSIQKQARQKILPVIGSHSFRNSNTDMHSTTDSIAPEILVAVLAVGGLCCVAVWRVVRWLHRSPPTPDPWDESTGALMDKEDATPLCHRCLSPHDSSVNFCLHCGATVGQYTNWLPYPYLFSVGHALRIGTSGEFKRSPLTIIGFMLLGLAEFSLLVPLYWIVFLKKILGKKLPEKSTDELPPTQ